MSFLTKGLLGGFLLVGLLLVGLFLLRLLLVGLLLVRSLLAGFLLVRFLLVGALLSTWRHRAFIATRRSLLRATLLRGAAGARLRGGRWATGCHREQAADDEHCEQLLHGDFILLSVHFRKRERSRRSPRWRAVQK